MFEFKTSIHSIPGSQLALYYVILIVIYIFFLRKLKLTYLTMFILIVFNQGFVMYFDSLNRFSRVALTAITGLMLYSSDGIRIDRVLGRLIFLFMLFTISLLTNYLSSGNTISWMLFQYQKFLVPFILFVLLRNQETRQSEYNYYTEVIIKMVWFQIVFSVVKLIVIGFRENIIGSISDLGGGIGVGLTLIISVLYWVHKDKNLSGFDWFFLLAVLIIPIASNKRAIWFIYPLLLLIMNIDRLSLLRIIFIFLIGAIIVYIGFRMNPTLNPERKLWGSFDAEYAIDYAMGYSGVSEERLYASEAQGRWGTSMAILSKYASDPLNFDYLFGFKRSRSGGLGEETIIESHFNIFSVQSSSGIGSLLLKYGIIGSVLLMSIFIGMINTVNDRKTRLLLLLILLWDYLFYSSNFVDGFIETYLLVFTIILCSEKEKLNEIKAHNY